MITAHAVELRVGARVLLDDATFRIAAGDRIGLVGRNGAGKTTLTKTLAGETQPTGGTITRSGEVGYLPQDPRTGNLDVVAMDRILSARGLDQIVRSMRETEGAMASAIDETRDAAMERYARLEARFTAAGGYAAESEASRIASNLGLDERVLGQTIGTLSGGQRRRVELARILFSGVETLLLDEPTNHLDADSIIWLRDFLKGYSGGLVVISHDVDLLRATVNKVFHLDANRGELDQYNLGWDAYILQRETDEKRTCYRGACARETRHQGKDLHYTDLEALPPRHLRYSLVAARRIAQGSLSSKQLSSEKENAVQCERDRSEISGKELYSNEMFEEKPDESGRNGADD